MIYSKYKSANLESTTKCYILYKWVFSNFLNWLTEVDSRIFLGRLFQMVGPATENNLSPIAFLEAGMMRRVLSIADLVIGPLVGIGLTLIVSMRYWGAELLRHLKMRRQSLYLMRLYIWSQWSLCNNGWGSVRLGTAKMSLAALFCMDCRRRRSRFDSP